MTRACYGLILALTVVPALQAEPVALTKHANWVTSVAFAPDKTLLTVGGQTLMYRPGDVKLWDSASGAEKPAPAGSPHPTTVWAAAWAPDGKSFATGGYDGLVKIWDVAGNKERHNIPAHKHWVRRLAFSPDSQLLATASEDGTVKLWDANSAADKGTLTGHAGTVYGVAFSPDGKTIITTSSDKTIRLWDVNPVKERLKIEGGDGHADVVWSVAVASNGQFATGGADRVLKVWSADGKLQATLPGHKDWITCVAASPDGKYWATASQDRTVKIWDAASRQEAGALTGLKSSLWSVAFSPDSSLIATGSHGEGVRLWRVADKKEVFEAPKPADAAKTEPAKTEPAKTPEKK